MFFVLIAYGKCSKILDTSLSVLKSNVCLYAGIQKMVVTIANREDPDQTASSEAV